MEANRVPNWNMGDRMPCANNLIWLSYISTHQGLFQNRQWDFQIPSVTSEFSSLWMPLWFIIKTLLGSRHYYLQLSEVFKTEVDKHQDEERPPNTDRRKATQHRPGCWKMKSTLPLSLSVPALVTMQPHHEWLLTNGSGGPAVYPGLPKDHLISGDNTRGAASTGSWRNSTWGHLSLPACP